MAAPTKLTPEVQQVLVRAISLGATLKAAAQAAGITYDCLNDWQHLAEHGRQPYVHLFQELAKAEGARQMRWLAYIEKAANEGTWTAAAWKLERLYSETYALKNKLDVTVNIEELDDDQLDAYIQAASDKRLGPPAGRTRAKTA